MNIQTIQIMILLLDGFIKLAPWRVVMEAMGRIGYRLRQKPVRGPRLAVSAITGLGAAAMVSILGPAFFVGSSHVSRDGLAFGYIACGFYVGLMLWIGSWLRGCNAGRSLLARAAWKFFDASQPSKILIKLDFVKPFEAHNPAGFSFAPERGATATNVIWVMQSPSPFMSKVMQVFMNFDAMIGRDFEAGLANLKNLAGK